MLDYSFSLLPPGEGPGMRVPSDNITLVKKCHWKNMRKYNIVEVDTFSEHSFCDMMFLSSDTGQVTRANTLPQAEGDD
jgi:hypothetical protein